VSQGYARPKTKSSQKRLSRIPTTDGRSITAVVLQIRVHPPDQLGDIGPHASLNVELSHWRRRQARFTHRTALKLAAVELMDTPHRRLQPELEVIPDLRPELLVVTDLDEVLNPSMSVEMRCETIRAVAEIEWSLCEPRMREIGDETFRAVIDAGRFLSESRILEARDQTIRAVAT
jgi:hypothetical protein